MYPREESSSYQQQPPPLPINYIQQQPLLQGPSAQPSYQTTDNRGATMTNPSHSSVYIGDPQFNGFDQKSIRNAFVAKVYSILSIQLLFSALIIAWFTLHTPTKNYFGSNEAVYWIFLPMTVGIISMFVLACIDSARRSFPLNYCILTILTVAYALMAGMMAARFDTITVLSAAGTTAFACVVVYLLAKYSPFDITGCGCGLCILALVHLITGLLLTVILVPMGYGHTASMLIAGSAAFILSLYLLFDLQIIMGGRRYELSPEEYILAAVFLYIDIIQLFQNMLILFGDRR